MLDEVLLRIKNMTPREIGFLTLSPLHALRERVKAGLEGNDRIVGKGNGHVVHGIYSWEENYKLK